MKKKNKTKSLRISGFLAASCFFALFVIIGVSQSNQALLAKSLFLGSSKELYVRGKSVYQAECAACHHSDPRKSGPMGPSISDLSWDLLYSRVMGDSSVQMNPKKEPKERMVPLPHLKNDLEALYEFLNSGAY